MTSAPRPIDAATRPLQSTPRPVGKRVAPYLPGLGRSSCPQRPGNRLPQPVQTAVSPAPGGRDALQQLGHRREGIVLRPIEEDVPNNTAASLTSRSSRAVTHACGRGLRRSRGDVGSACSECGCGAALGERSSRPASFVSVRRATSYVGGRAAPFLRRFGGRPRCSGSGSEAVSTSPALSSRAMRHYCARSIAEIYEYSKNSADQSANQRLASS
jgi:hypothetical protein